MKRVLPYILLSLIICLAGQVGVVTYKQWDRETRQVRIIKNSLPKTVMIQVAGIYESQESTRSVAVRGAGVFISPTNHVLTCAHLFRLKSINSISVCSLDGICTAAELLNLDDHKDLGLLRANFDEPTPYAELQDPRTLAVGQEVIAIGNPLGLEFSVSHGIISALYRDIGAFYNLTQTDVMINPGNSGGPLLDLEGKLVGINNLIIPVIPILPINTGLAFSVQSGQIIEFLSKFYGIESSIPKFKVNSSQEEQNVGQTK